MYTYTKTGNRIGETRGASATIYTHSAGNRIETRGTETYTHDNNGNIKTVTTSAGTTTYTYDYENRLIGAAMPNGTTATYKYDAFGRRIQKAVNACSSPGSCILTTVSYLYDGDNILFEYDGNNAIKTRYTHNYSIDDPLAMERDGQVYYYQKDALGSITAITDSTGNVVQRYDYDAFGNIVSVQNPAFVQPYAFTGREYDAETGNYYYRARTYNPIIGRFMQEDPIGFAGGDYNLYRYVGNSPQSWIDPSGELAWVVGGAVIGGVLNLASQYNSQTGFQNFNWTSFGASIATGALSGGLGTATQGLGFLANVIANSVGSGVIGAGVTLVTNAIDPCHSQSVSQNAWQSAVYGGLGALGGNLIAKVFVKAPQNLLWGQMSLAQRLQLTGALQGPFGTPLPTIGTFMGNLYSNFVSNMNQ